MNTISNIISSLFKLILLFFSNPRKGLLTIELIFKSIKNPLALIQYKVVDDKELFEYLILNGLSLARWGDGDSRYYYYKYNYFQNIFSQEIIQSLENLIKLYKPNSHYILGLPLLQLNNSFFKLVLSGKLKTWYDTRAILNTYLLPNYNYIFADSFAFKSKNITKMVLDKISLFDRLLVISDNKKKYSELFTSNKIETHYYKIPTFNASILLKEIINEINNLSVNSRLLVLLSAGNIARVLVERINNHNVIIIDLGNF